MRIFIGLLLAFLSSSLLAAPPTPKIYEIEVIVFSHINSEGLNSETWPILGAPELNLENASTLLVADEDKLDKSATPNNYTILPNYDFNLNRSMERLIASPHYKAILHLAWRQPILGPHQAKWIHIYGGSGFDAMGNIVAENMDGTVAYDQAAHWQVDGLMRFDVRHYFNTRYRLGFAAPSGLIQNLSGTNNFSNMNTPLVYFKLDQFRRMKSRELNYIGHPLYGVLVYISPVASAD